MPTPLQGHLIDRVAAKRLQALAADRSKQVSRHLRCRVARDNAI